MRDAQTPRRSRRMKVTIAACAVTVAGVISASYAMADEPPPGPNLAHTPNFTPAPLPSKHVMVYTQKVISCFILNYKAPDGNWQSATFGDKGEHWKVPGNGWTDTGIYAAVNSTVSFKTYWVDCSTAKASPNKNWAESGTWYVAPTNLTNIWINSVDSAGSHG